MWDPIGDAGEVRILCNTPKNFIRRSRIARQAARHRRARFRIDRIDKAQSELDELSFFFRRMRGFLHVELGQYAQQSRLHIEPALGKPEQAVHAGNQRRTHATTPIALLSATV
jgi:hypothetical protein